MKHKWNLQLLDDEIVIQQDEPYTELVVGNTHRRFRKPESYYEIKLSESIFEINISFTYYFGSGFELFHSEAQIWKYYQRSINFVLDTLKSGNFGTIRIKKITSPKQEKMNQDIFIEDWILKTLA